MLSGSPSLPHDVQANQEYTTTLLLTHLATPTTVASRPLAATQQALLSHSGQCTTMPLTTGPFQERAIILQHLRHQVRRPHKQRTGAKEGSFSEGLATAPP